MINFRPIFLTLGVLILAWLLSRYVVYLPQALTSLYNQLPFGLAALGIILALSFQRSRMAQLILLLAASYWLLISFDDRPWYPQLLTLLAVLLPFNILLFGLYRERGLLTLSSLMRLAVVALQAGLVLWVVARQPLALSEFLHQTWWPWWVVAASPFGQFSQLIALVCVLIILVLALRSASWLESSVFSALVLMVTVFHFQTDAYANIALFSMAPLAISLAILLDSYSMAYIDELTGLPGRRALREQMARLSGLYTLAMLDVDHFKKFNDTYGHDVGDQVLKFVAGKMRKVGGGGKAYRYGGEEFTFLFPGKTLDVAIPYLERVREDIAQSGFALRSQDRPKKPQEGSRGRKSADKYVGITASLGVAEHAAGLMPDEVLKEADEALYRAKAGGRNRISQ